jgi:hypothetical protein
MKYGAPFWRDRVFGIIPCKHLRPRSVSRLLVSVQLARRVRNWGDSGPAAFGGRFASANVRDRVGSRLSIFVAIILIADAAAANNHRLGGTRDMLWPELMAAVFMLGSSDTAPQTLDRLHYEVEGLMSRSIELDVDLTTGEYSLSEGELGPQTRTMNRTTGTIDSSRLSRIKKVANLASVVGFETKACQREETARQPNEIKAPIFDQALPLMTLQFNGRSLTAPGRSECWNKAANDLLDIALASARSGE